MNLVETIKSHMTDHPTICDGIMDIKLRCSFPMKLVDSTTDASGMEVVTRNPEYTVIVEVSERITLKGERLIDGAIMHTLRQAVYHSFPEDVFTKRITNIEIQQHNPLIPLLKSAMNNSDLDWLFD